MRLSPTSLRTRLLLLVAAAFVPAAMLTARNIRADREESLADVRTRLARLLAQADADNDAAIQSGRRIVATWAEVPDVHSGTPAECAAAFARLARFAPAVASPTRININGVIDCGGRTPGSIGVNVANNPLFQQVLASDSAALGPYIAADSTRAALVPVNMPLRDSNGRLTGMISVGIRLDWFERLTRNADLPPGTLATVSDSSGLLLAHYPASPLVGKTRPGLAARFAEDRKRGAEERGWVVRNTLDGVRRLVSHERLQSTPGSLVRVAVAMPPEVAFAEPNRRARVRVTLLLGTALVALLIALYGAHVVVLRDVDVILRATRRLGSGDLSARTGLDDRVGEIGQLAQSFDAMASQLEHRQERMRHAERLESLGTLAGGVAHDFNNMLTAIVGSADLALTHVPPEHPAHDDLLTIKSSASRSSTLTRQLLDFSRRGPLVTRPERLDQLVQESAALLTRVVPATVSIDVHTHSHRLAQVDAGRIEQAIVNLAVNARDAMPQGGTITIALDDHDVTQDDGTPVPPGQWIRLQVRDTGTGIPPEVLRRIFEPFFTTKGAGEGTGLGLSMVYGTVQHHGGHVQVDSVVGRGTTVSIWLPATSAEHFATASPPSVSTPLAATVRVLVAEDQPEVRLLIKRVLERAGYAVQLAADGNTALHMALSQLDSSLVLVTDYDMPEVRGDELALALREQLPTLPIVLMSGFASDGWPASLVGSPGVALVEKPFSPDSLLQAVLAARQ
ncbi:ATP-binding protein [Gemmatimonas sp.]